MENLITPKLVYEDKEAINRTKDKVNNTLPLITDVFNAYNEIAVTSNLPELSNEDFTDLFNDVEGFIKTVKVNYYNATFAPAHEALGIGFDKGYDLVSDKMPDLTKVSDACKVYFSTIAKNVYGYSGNHFFTIQDGKIEIDADALNKAIEDDRIYFTKPNELAFLEAANEFVESFKTMNEIINTVSPGLSLTECLTGHHQTVSFDKIKALFTQSNSQVLAEDFRVSTEVLRKIKLAN